MYKIIFIENPSSNFEPKHFESQKELTGKKGTAILDNELKLSAKKVNPFLITLAILLLIITQARYFSFLFPFILILIIIFLILTIVSFARSKTEETIIRFNEIKSLDLQEYGAGLLKIKRTVINIKTSSKDIWITGVDDKENQKIYDVLKSKTNVST